MSSYAPGWAASITSVGGMEAAQPVTTLDEARRVVKMAGLPENMVESCLQDEEGVWLIGIPKATNDQLLSGEIGYAEWSTGELHNILVEMP